MQQKESLPIMKFIRRLLRNKKQSILVKDHFSIALIIR